MSNLKISTRLMLLIGLLLALLVAIGGLGLYGISKSNDALKSVYEDRTVPTGQLGEIKALLLDNRLNLNIALITPTPEVIRAETAGVEANIAAISKIWDAYMATKLTVEEEKLAKVFAEDRKKFVLEGLLPAVAALRANDLQEAQRVGVEKVHPLFVAVDSGIAALTPLQIDEAHSAYKEAAARYALI